MRKRAKTISIAVMVLALIAFVRGLPARRSIPSFPLSAVILGLTNTPGAAWQYGTSTGSYALVAFTNRAWTAIKEFGIVTIETQSSEGWKAHWSDLDGKDFGADWGPDFGLVYAIPWPSDLPVDKSSRLRLWVEHESNQLLRRNIPVLGTMFSSRTQRYTVFSTTLNPQIISSLQSGAGASNSQPSDPANGSQQIRSETNRTSSAAGSRR